MQASFTDFYKSQHSEKVNISMIPANNNFQYIYKNEVKYQILINLEWLFLLRHWNDNVVCKGARVAGVL